MVQTQVNPLGLRRVNAEIILISFLFKTFNTFLSFGHHWKQIIGQDLLEKKTSLRTRLNSLAKVLSREANGMPVETRRHFA